MSEKERESCFKRDGTTEQRDGERNVGRKDIRGRHAGRKRDSPRMCS